MNERSDAASLFVRTQQTTIPLSALLRKLLLLQSRTNLLDSGAQPHLASPLQLWQCSIKQSLGRKSTIFWYFMLCGVIGRPRRLPHLVGNTQISFRHGHVADMRRFVHGPAQYLSTSCTRISTYNAR